MKTVNRIFILSLLLLFSCKSYDLDTTWQKIKEMQVEEYAKNPHGYSGKLKQYNDSSHLEFYRLREQKINTFIEQKELQDFIIKDVFYKYHDMAKDDYVSTIYTLDSAYIFHYGFSEKEIESFKSENSHGCLYLTFTRDSLIMNRQDKPAYPEIGNACVGNIFPSYLSVYKKGKLDFLMKSDSVIYRDKKSKVVIDLETVVYTYDDDKVCKEKNGLFICNDGSSKRCKKDSSGYFSDCKKLK